MASILRFDKWEDTQGNTLATVESGEVIIPSIPPPSIQRHNVTLRSGINISNVTGLSYTDNLSAYLNLKVFAVTLSVGYQHGGSTNHGYWSGYFVQSGKNSQETKKGYWSEAHYDWYYNAYEKEITIPWDPSGSTNLETYTTNSYNTSSANIYNTRLKSVWTIG